MALGYSGTASEATCRPIPISQRIENIAGHLQAAHARLDSIHGILNGGVDSIHSILNGGSSGSGKNPGNPNVPQPPIGVVERVGGAESLALELVERIDAIASLLG